MRITLRINSRRGQWDTRQVTGTTKYTNTQQLLQDIIHKINDNTDKPILFHQSKAKTHDIIIFPKTIKESLQSQTKSIRKNEYSSGELMRIVIDEGLITCKRKIK